MKFLRIAASAFVLLLLAGFALAFSVYQSYSDLAELNRRAKLLFADWEAALAPQRVLLNDLAEITSAYDPAADDLQAEAEQVLEEAPQGNNVTARISLHMTYGKAFARLRGLAERYPQLRSSDNFHEWETSLLKSELAEEAARLNYNSVILEYNAVLNTFMGKLIALLFNIPDKPLIPDS